MKQIDILVPEPLLVKTEELAKHLGVERDFLICLAVHEKLNRDGATRQNNRETTSTQWKTHDGKTATPFRASL
jgi:hypothetical protein